MGPLSELLATTERQALEFFVIGLQDVSETALDRRELLYNASVLAHFAQVSTEAGTDSPAPRSLVDVFDQYVLDATAQQDAALLEVAAAQCLLLAGFFEGQMRRRHNIRWYADLGAGFFRRAAVLERSHARADLLDMLGRHFEPWRARHARLGRHLQTQRYLITPREPLDG